MSGNERGAKIKREKDTIRERAREEKRKDEKCTREKD